jgi:hypothetical protein
MSQKCRYQNNIVKYIFITIKMLLYKVWIIYDLFLNILIFHMSVFIYLLLKNRSYKKKDEMLICFHSRTLETTLGKQERAKWKYIRQSQEDFLIL